MKKPRTLAHVPAVIVIVEALCLASISYIRYMCPGIDVVRNSILLGSQPEPSGLCIGNFIYPMFCRPARYLDLLDLD